ncbi:MAG TPA: hypothetical protein VGM39_22855 [Kofleriaceae bacterium]|jgi:hypothetical protein
MLSLGNAITEIVSTRGGTADYFAQCKQQLATSMSRSDSTDAVDKLLPRADAQCDRRDPA